MVHLLLIVDISYGYNLSCFTTNEGVGAVEVDVVILVTLRRKDGYYSPQLEETEGRMSTNKRYGKFKKPDEF